MADFRRLAPARVDAAGAALRAVYATVFSAPPYNEGPEMAGEFLERLTEDSRRPGFSLVAAYDGGRLLGFAYGYTMPAGRWWRGTDRPAPGRVKAADKLAVIEWAVVPDRRGRGIGRRLLDELLSGRRERYATLTVNPAAGARAVYERLGWRQVASTRPGRMPAMAVMVLDLPRVDQMREASVDGAPGSAWSSPVPE